MSNRQASSRSRRVLDEDEILRTYNISSLSPSRWEEVDSNDLEEPANGSASSSKRDEPDALGLRRGGTLASLPEVSSDMRSAIMLHSKTFDPKAYLATVHPNAAFKDLSRGRENVKDALEQRSEALKVLVEAEFDRFVGVKAATEGVYQEMKQGPLASGSDYGVSSLKTTLKEASTRADSVYTPILDAAMKATRLRSTLTVFERNKFFFNLPGALLQAIEIGRYDTAMLAYRKGKYMVEGGRPQTLLGLPPNAPTTPLQEQQSRRIYNKVWGGVQKIMNDLKVQLSAKLEDPKLPSDEVNKTIEILLELDPDSDPAWIYLQAQHGRILDSISRAFEDARDKYDAHFASSARRGTATGDDVMAASIKAAVDALEQPDTEALLSEGEGAAEWRALQHLVRRVSDSVVTSLPAFWKVAKTYMEGRYHKRSIPSSSKRNFNFCNSMANEIVMHLITTLSKFFKFSHELQTPPPPAAPADGEQPARPVPNFVPQPTTALTASVYILRLLGDLGDIISELGSLGLPKQAGDDLDELLSSARWRFTDVLCLLWVRDSKVLYRLERWKQDPDLPTTTVFLRQADCLQRSIARRAYRIIGGSEDAASALFLPLRSTPGSLQPPAADSLSGNFSRRVQTAYLDALYAFLDGLVHVAFSEASEPNDLLGTRDMDGGPKTFDPTNVDNRIMLTVSNLDHIQNATIGRTVAQFQEAFKIDMTSDLATLRDVISQIDKILFENYVQRKTEHIAKILQSGILPPAIDWANAPKPTEVRSYIYESLLQLVLVHAQITAVAKPLTSRVLSALVDEIASEALRCFTQVREFGIGGMLQATLEIEFLHQTVSQYVTPEADKKLQEIYKTISQAYYRQPNKNSEELAGELEQLKKTLMACRRATALQFLCFRRASSKSSSRSQPSGRSNRR